MIEVVAALIWDNKQRFLICQRPAHKQRGLLWEFVGGKVEAGESQPEALIRECKEELAIEISVEQEFMSLTHNYPDIEIRLTIFNATIRSGVPQLLEHHAIKWINPVEIDQFDFCPADQAILEEIKKHYHSDN